MVYLLVFLGVPLLIAAVVALLRRRSSSAYYDGLPTEDLPAMTDLLTRGSIGHVDRDK